MHFGSLSCREFYWRCQDVVDKYKGRASQPPTSLTGQLLFRDMYFGAQASLGYAFGQTYGNSHCRFIPWHLPSKIDTSSGLITGEYLVDNAQAEVYFKRWREGRTGFPWIDALMRQLKYVGWIHHLGRHAVACFLTRGGCYVDWERGAEVFEEWLIDHEAAWNIGNWQWLSCTAFYAQFYRCYSPIAFPQKWDKEGAFVRKFVPELENFPPKYIYEPWKAPIADQKKWGCVIKGDGSEREVDGKKAYPKPMFDFPTQREVCIEGVKNAYQIGLYGNNPKVLDGTWRKHFEDNAEGPTEGSKGPPGAMVEHEHAYGHEENDVPEPPSPKTSKKGKADNKAITGNETSISNTGKTSKAGHKMEPSETKKSTKVGHKREAIQGTLDKMITRKKKRDNSDIADYT